MDPVVRDAPHPMFNPRKSDDQAFSERTARQPFHRERLWISYLDLGRTACNVSLCH